VTRGLVTRTNYIPMSSRLQDRESLRRARLGDRSAFAALVERHYPLLLACCRRALADAELARDAAQQATLSAMLGLDRLRDDERFGPWLIGIGLNLCRALLRDRARHASSLELLLDDGRMVEPRATGPDPELHAEAGDVEVRVREAIADLPAGQRDAIALFYIAGLTHAEIAEQLGTAPGAIKTRLYKARHSLRVPLNELWKEYFAMTTEETGFVPMHIADLRRTAATEPASVRSIVFLEDDDGSRRLPIWIGPAEATALAVILEEVELPRPGIHQFAAKLLAAAGGGLREVRLVELANYTFYAQAVLSDGTTVDARPSDALTLALHLSAPIYVARAVLDQADELADADGALGEKAIQLRGDAKTIAEETRTRLRAESDLLDELSRQAG
jgi:RNA polymerase sigma-70 factor (ECF subfamily)